LMDKGMAQFLDMSERVIVVTGGAQGIGWGIVCTFLREGGTVLCVDLVKPDEKAVAGLGSYRDKLHYVDMDISDPELVMKFFNRIEGNFGKVDVLVNNAGVMYKTTIENMDCDKWDKVIRVNLTGSMLMARAAIPSMKKQSWGRIMNIASTQAFVGTKTYGAYTASKAGMVGLTRVLAAELVGDNITVNTVCPSFARTPMINASVDALAKSSGLSREEALAQFVSQCPQKRLIEPEEIGHVLVFLASDMARGITGQIILVNGGRFMR
jgi:3-hydroxybutyrate dehydrogenase